MDKSSILADLRAQFGNVAVLYAPQIAILLNKPTSGAVLEHIKRGGFPLPILLVGGRPAVSIYAAVDWLAGDTPKPKKAEERSDQPGSSKPEVSDAKRKSRASIANAMAAIRAQRNFLGELDGELEAIIFKEDLAKKAQKDRKNDAAKSKKLAKKSLAERSDIL